MRALYLGIVLVGLSLAGCEGGSSRLGWSNYYVASSDLSHVYLWKQSTTNAIVVDEQIVDLRIEDDYALVRRKVAQSVDCYDKNNSPTIITHYSEEDEY